MAPDAWPSLRAARVALTLLLIGFSASACAAQARRPIPPWCAWDPGANGFHCSFYTHEQCMADAWGNGGLCVPNPRAPFGDVRVRRRRR